MNRRELLLTPALLLAQPAFDNAILGANAAISGYSLEQAIRTVKDLCFATIEIEPMGEPQPRSGLFPGFQFDRLGATQRKAIRDWLKGFRNITTDLPYHDLHFFSSTPTFATSPSVTALPSTKTMDQAWPEILDRFRQWGDRARKLGFLLRKLRQVNDPGLLVLEIGAPDTPRALADSRDRLRHHLKQV